MKSSSKSRAFLLIEVIFALSLFAIFAGAITQGFMTGLNVRNQSDANLDPNDLIKINLLIDRIQSEHSKNNSSDIKVEAEFPTSDKTLQKDAEKWTLTVKNKKEIKSIGSENNRKHEEELDALESSVKQDNKYGKLYELELGIANDRDENNKFAYNIFKFLKKAS